MNGHEFHTLSESESATIEGGFGWVGIAAGVLIWVGKDIVDHWAVVKRAYREGYEVGTANYHMAQ